MPKHAFAGRNTQQFINIRAPHSRISMYVVMTQYFLRNLVLHWPVTCRCTVSSGSPSWRRSVPRMPACSSGPWTTPRDLEIRWKLKNLEPLRIRFVLRSLRPSDHSFHPAKKQKCEQKQLQFWSHWHCASCQERCHKNFATFINNGQSLQPSIKNNKIGLQPVSRHVEQLL